MTAHTICTTLLLTVAALAQAPPEAGQAKPAPGRGMMREMPKPGPCPLPTLPALPAYDDASFFAGTNVPHGRVEQAA